MNQASPDPQLLTLSTLLQLQRDARSAKSLETLSHLIVNETHHLIPFQQSVLWQTNRAGTPKVEAVSSVAQPDRNAPYIQWLQQLIKLLRVGDNNAQERRIHQDDIPLNLQDGWQEWSPGVLLWLPMGETQDTPNAGMLLFREQPWSEGEIILLQNLTGAYHHSLLALKQRRQSSLGKLGSNLLHRPYRFLLALLLLSSLALPINESALAPAEVSPSLPIVVTAPLDGVVKEFYVKPNQRVMADELLFSLDETVIQSQNEVAAKVLAIAKADYLRASQKAFRDNESKAKLASLRAVVAEKTSELEYSSRLLQRMQVRAEQAGIALFADPNEWLGKPVVTGEKVLTLADPAHTELRAWIPVSDAINLAAGAEVRFFLNTDPTHPLEATLYQTTYEAEVAPDGILAFLIKAHFNPSTTPPRIGLKGTAKIYGQEVTLFYYLFRRPISSLRQFFGL